MGYKVKETRDSVETLIDSLIKYDKEEFSISLARTHSRKMEKVVGYPSEETFKSKMKLIKLLLKFNQMEEVLIEAK